MWKFATASLATIDKANTARVQLFPAAGLARQMAASAGIWMRRSRKS
ncbi:Uncharacterised protein [Cedecea neteri]|uniref:Uncharacterized protein n=1 Tax=Cedecea neteri TaxID=158822 RepID=A0A2X2SXK5_9ENTR|nr:Uncharacterised protein [Cedecea neteri]